jgi:tape measure domain-containing protein
MSEDLELKIRIGAELKEIRTALAELRGDMKKVGTEGKRAGSTASAGMDAMSKQIKTLKRQMVGFLGVWASISTMKGIVRLADEYKEVNARLKLASRSQEEYLSNQELIFQLAQDTRTQLAGTVDLYARISRSTKELGTSQLKRLKVTEAINKSIKISGANSESANAAIVQLGQGLASGALRGEELNSVMEQTPRLAEAIAAGMGVSLGQLRQLGAEGKITAETIIQALLSQSQVIDEEFKQLPVTVEQAITTIENGFVRWIGQTDEAYGATQALAEGLQFLGENMDAVLDIAIRSAALIATAYGFKATFAVKKLITEMILAGNITVDTAGKVNRLKNAFNVLGSAIIGWEIGSWLRQEFLVVEQAGIALMGGLQETWARLVAFFKRSAAYLRYILQAPFDGLRDKVSEFFNDMADIAEMIPKIGKDIASGLRQAGDFVKPMSAAAKQYREEVKKINDDLKTEIDGIVDVYSDLMNKADQSRKTKDKAPPAPSTTTTATSSAQKKAIVADQVALAKAEVDAAIRELERLKSESLVSFSDYYAKRRDLQIKQIDLEIAANNKSLASATKDDQKAKILAEIIVLEKQRGEIAAAASRDQASAERDLADELNKVKVNLLKLQGNDVQARQLALEAQYKDIIQRLKVEGDEAGQQLVKALINTELAKTRLSELKTKFSDALNEMRAEEQSIKARVDVGEISLNQGEKELVAIRQKQLSILHDLIAATKELASETKDPAIIKALTTMSREYESAARKVNDVSDKVKDSMETSIGQGLIDLAEGAKNLKDVFKDMAVSVLKTLQEIYAKKIAAAIVSSVFHAGGIAGQGGRIRSIDPSVFSFAPRYHAGGIAGLAPNEVPAILNKGEEVLTKTDPRHSANASGAPAQSVKMVLVDDRGSIGDYMSSGDGEKVLVETIRRNSGVIKKIING